MLILCGEKYFVCTEIHNRHTHTHTNFLCAESKNFLILDLVTYEASTGHYRVISDNGKLSSGSPDFRWRQTWRHDEDNWSNLVTFRLRTCPKLEHMYAHVQQIIVGKKTKCVSTDPFLREVFPPRFISLFYDILYIYYYVTVPWDLKLVSPSAADFYILHNRSTS